MRASAVGALKLVRTRQRVHATVALGVAGGCEVRACTSATPRSLVAVHARVVEHATPVALEGAYTSGGLGDEAQEAEESDPALMLDEEVVVSRHGLLHEDREVAQGIWVRLDSLLKMLSGCPEARLANDLVVAERLIGFP